MHVPFAAILQLFLPPSPKDMGGYVFASIGVYVDNRYIGLFVNNFLVPIQVQLLPNLVSHTLGYRGQGD